MCVTYSEQHRHNLSALQVVKYYFPPNVWFDGLMFFPNSFLFPALFILGHSFGKRKEKYQFEIVEPPCWWNMVNWWGGGLQTMGEPSSGGIPLFYYYLPKSGIVWLPWWLSGKESICKCRRCGFSPWVGKIPWRRKWQCTVLAWEMPWTEEPWWATVHEDSRVRHNLVTKQQRQQQGLLIAQNPT